MSHQQPNFYQRHSVGIMAILVFLLPLVLVGAVKARSNNRNDVKGWLPAEYPETRTYGFFRRSFQGEEFVLASWTGCTMADPRLEMLAQKLLPPPEEAARIDRTLFFKTAQTGPRAVERMTSEPLNLDREEAISRLTGALIGPAPAGVEPFSEGDDPDARQTCLVLTLSDAARANLHGAIDMVKDVATKECGIPAAEIRLGGPPVDNVSIDKAGQPVTVETFGRHDPCVGIRATPIAEAMLAIVLMDHALRHRAQNADVDVATPRIAAQAPEGARARFPLRPTSASTDPHEG